MSKSYLDSFRIQRKRQREETENVKSKKTCSVINRHMRKRHFLLVDGCSTCHFMTRRKKPFCRNHFLGMTRQFVKQPQGTVLCKTCVKYLKGEKVHKLSESTLKAVPEKVLSHDDLPKKMSNVLNKHRTKRFGTYPDCKIALQERFTELAMKAFSDSAQEILSSLGDSVVIFGNGQLSESAKEVARTKVSTLPTICCNNYAKWGWDSSFGTPTIQVLGQEALKEEETMKLPGYKIAMTRDPPEFGELGVTDSWTEEARKIAASTRECTRGFYIVVLMLALKKKVILLGFGGKGHHNNPYARIAHGVSHEHRLYKQWKEENRQDFEMF